MKKLITLVLCLGLLVSLVGCGSKEEKVNKEDTTSSKKEIVLDFPSWQASEPGFGDWWNEVIAEFEKTHENVKIDFYQIPFNAYVDTLTTKFGANSPPDITHLVARNLPQFAEMGWLESLDDRLAGTDILDNWTTLQNGMVQDGKNYGVLLLGTAFHLFYNEAMFKEAGIEVPTTAEQLIEAARKLTIDKDKDGVMDQFGFGATTTTHNNVYSDASMFVVGNGGHWTKDSELNLNDSKLIEGIKQYNTIFDEKLAPSGLTDVQKRQYFVEGKIAMIMDGPWVSALIKDAPDDIKPNLKVASLPFEFISGRLSNSIHIPVSIDDERKQLVWEFIQLLSTEKFQARYAELTSSPAPRIGVITDEMIKQNPLLESFSADVKKAIDITPIGYEKDFAQFSKLIVDHMLELQTTDIGVEELLDKLGKEIKKNIN